MAPTKLDIMNMALGYIGTRTITALDENSPEAIQCNLYWDRARRTVLRDYPFDFAVRRVWLNRRTVPSVYLPVWEYGYVPPAGCLKVLSIHSRSGDERLPFAVEYESGVEVILCHVEKAQATYVHDAEEIGLWDEQFVACMAQKLALLVSNALLKNNPEKIKELASLYGSTLPVGRRREEFWAAQAGATKLGICNMALGFINARMIAALNEDVHEAVICNVFWDRARRSALRDFPYPFAVKRMKLEEVPVPELYSRQWRHCYKRPADALKVSKVHGGFDGQHRHLFAIESTGTGDIILCNVPDAQATCTVDVPDVDRWDEMFITMMARKLAIMIYPAVKGGAPNGN